MSTNARWIIGLLLALVIGLGVGLVIVAGDNSEGESTTETITGETTVAPTTTAEPTTPTAPPTTTEDSGGVPAP